MLNKIGDAIVNLLKVKSLITMAMIFTVCYLAFKDRIDITIFMTLVSSIITYYFTKKDDNKDDNSSGNDSN